MGFKRVPVVNPPAPPVEPRQRIRAPQALEAPILEAPPSPPPIIATYCLDIHVSDTAQMFEMARAMLKSDGVPGSDIGEMLKANGMVDIGACIKVCLRRTE